MTTVFERTPRRGRWAHRRSRWWYASALSLALLAGSAAGPAARAQSDGVSPVDDAFHYASWSGGTYDATYTEWWYFNFFDARSGVQAIVSYFVTNPANLGGRQRAQLVAVAYTAQGVVSETDLYAPGAFSAGSQQADVTIGEALMRLGDDGAYRVSGASRDGRLSWDLIYAADVEPWLAADRAAIGSMPWERMSWLVYMPRARVTGRLTVDGRSFEIDAPGYHDHNWGEWFPPDALWNWAQFSDARVALEMGDFIGRPTGAVSVDFDGRRTVFTKGQYWLLHTRWGLDGRNGVWYPTETLLVAGDDTRRVFATIRTIATEPLRAGLPAPIPDVIVYEQTARYDGMLWEKDQTGQWVASTPLRGDGFKEYTANRY